jgi:hypothetical protein
VFVSKSLDGGHKVVVMEGGKSKLSIGFSKKMLFFNFLFIPSARQSSGN